MPLPRVITLLSDFGTADGYVAAMKGVILREAPGVRLVDASHDLPAHDVAAAAWALYTYWRYFPRGTLHLAVVDPGVGSARRALLARASGHWFLAPDNGLLGWILAAEADACVWSLRSSVHRPGPVSPTFHGRDVFAYAAARMAANRGAWSSLGKRISDPVRPDSCRLITGSGPLRGRIVHIDCFGNAVSNIVPPARAGWVTAGRRFRGHVRATYSDVNRGRALALVGSTGHLELAVREGNASRALGLPLGTPVTYLPERMPLT